MAQTVSNALLKKLNARYERQAVKKLDEHFTHAQHHAFLIFAVLSVFLAVYGVVSLIRSIFE